MTLVSDRTIENEDIRLDDHSFVNCHLVNCRIFYAGGYLDSTIPTSRNPSGHSMELPNEPSISLRRLTSISPECKYHLLLSKNQTN
jgi:hypothetical protein